MTSEQEQPRWAPVVVGHAVPPPPDVGHVPAGVGTAHARTISSEADDVPLTPLDAGPSPAAEDLAAEDLAAGIVAHRAISASVKGFLALEHGLVTTTDMDTIHRARVASRRLRSDLRTFGPLFLRPWVKELRAEMRSLSVPLGAVRDADVLLDRMTRRVRELDAVDRPAAMVVVEWARDERDRSRTALAEFVESAQYAALRHHISDAGRAPLFSKRAARSAGHEIRALVRRPWKRLRREVDALGDHPSDEALHEVRILVKRCRYASEAAAPVLGQEATTFARALRGLQNRLGMHQDAVTAEAWLRGIVGFLDAPAAFAAGRLVSLEQAAVVRGRTEWRSSWKSVRRNRLR